MHQAKVALEHELSETEGRAKWLRARIKEIDAQLRPAVPGGKRTARATGTKRARRGQRLEETQAALASNPKIGSSELAKALGISPSQASTLLKKARAQ